MVWQSVVLQLLLSINAGFFLYGFLSLIGWREAVIDIAAGLALRFSTDMISCVQDPDGVTRVLVSCVQQPHIDHHQPPAFQQTLVQIEERHAI